MNRLNHFIKTAHLGKNQCGQSWSGQKIIMRAGCKIQLDSFKGKKCNKKYKLEELRIWILHSCMTTLKWLGADYYQPPGIIQYNMSNRAKLMKLLFHQFYWMGVRYGFQSLFMLIILNIKPKQESFILAIYTKNVCISASKALCTM